MIDNIANRLLLIITLSVNTRFGQSGFYIVKFVEMPSTLANVGKILCGVLMLEVDINQFLSCFCEIIFVLEA